MRVLVALIVAPCVLGSLSKAKIDAGGINPAVLKAEYAVRGAILQRAGPAANPPSFYPPAAKFAPLTQWWAA